MHYAYVLVDDYSRYTWVCFLAHKNNAFNFCKKNLKRKRFLYLTIQSDHGTEFENELFKNFYNENSISHTFSSSRTPQQNGIVERKNKTLVEMVRTMLYEYNLPLYFWAKVVNTSCYIANRVFKRTILSKTSYEL